MTISSWMKGASLRGAAAKGDISECAEAFSRITDMDVVRESLERIPLLLDPRMLNALSTLAETKSTPLTKSFTFDRRALLSYCIEEGIDHACREWMKSTDEKAEDLDAFFAEVDPVKFVDVVKARRSLLTFETDMVLEKMCSTSRFTAFATPRREFLTRCRETSIEAAYRELAAEFGDPAVILTEYLENPGIDPADLIRRHAKDAVSPETDDLLRRAMLVVPLESMQMRLAMLRARLARCRELGVDAALTQPWRPGMLLRNPDDLLDDEGMSVDDLLAAVGSNERLLNALEGEHFQKQMLPPILDFGNAPAHSRRQATVFRTVGQWISRHAELLPAQIELGEWLLDQSAEEPDEHFRACVHVHLAHLHGCRTDIDPAQNELSMRKHFDAAFRFFSPDKPLCRRSLLWMAGNEYRVLALRMGPESATLLAGSADLLREALTLVQDEQELTAVHIRSELGSALLDMARSGNTSVVDEATEHLRWAVKGFKEQDLGPFGRTAIRNLMEAYGLSSRWDLALDCAQGGIAMSEMLFYENPFGSGKEHEAHTAAETYELAALCAAQAGKHNVAWKLFNTGRSRYLLQLMKLSMLQPPGATPEEWAAFQTATFELTRFLSGTTVTEGMDLPDDPSELFRILEEKHSKLDANYRSARSTLDSRIGRDEVSAFLRPTDSETAFVGVLCTELGSAVLIATQGAPLVAASLPGVTKKSVHAVLVGDPANPDAPGWIIDVLLGIEAHGGAHELAVAMSSMEHVLGKLSSDLLDPILKALPEKIRRIVFIPSGSLLMFPLHAVPTGTEQHCLLDRYEVSYAPSLEILEICERRSVQDKKLIVAAFADDETLAMAPVEAQIIAEYFPCAVIRVADGNPLDRMTDAMRGATAWHFACHGTYDWNDPLKSRLSLGDRHLALGDLMSAPATGLSVRLVVLSACDTGLVSFLHGHSPDQYLGLPAGFLAAGAACVVASLWRIQDLPTALLMMEMYRTLANDKSRPAAALRTAQLRLRSMTNREIADILAGFAANSKLSDSDKEFMNEIALQWTSRLDGRSLERPFSNPYFWAGFFTMGA